MPADPDFVIKAGDTNPPVQAILKDGNKRIVPLGVDDEVIFRMKRVKHDAPEELEGVSEIVDGPKGTVRYQWATGDTDTPGLYEADFHVTFAVGGAEASFPNGRSLLVQIIEPPGYAFSAGPSTTAKTGFATTGLTD